MKKLLSRVKQSNKGFTLIELIIVIAIIAVLAAVIAPQYLSYVEKSRVTTDANTIAEISHAVQVSATDETVNTAISSSGGTLKVNISAAGAFTYDSSSTAAIVTEVTKTVPAGSYTFKSKTYIGKSVTITITSAGVVTTGDPT